MKDYNEIAENVFRRRDEYEAKKLHRKKIMRKLANSLGVAALVATLLFSAGTCYVFAVGLGIAEDHLGICDNFFTSPMTQKQQDAVRSAAVPLGVTVTSDGISVTAQSAFTDGSTALISLKIVAPEHINLDQSALHFETDWREIIRGDNPKAWLGSGDSGMTQYPTDDQDGAKNTKQLLIRINTTSLPEYDFSFADGYDRYLSLEGLYAYEREFPYTMYQIADGKWNFRIRFDDSFCNTEKEMLDCPINLIVRRAMYDVPQTATVHSIVVRGLSVIFRYTYSADAVQEPGTFDDITIVLTDGTVINAKEGMGGSGNNGEFITTFVANAPILVDEIDYIQIGETVIVANQITHQGNPMIPAPEE